MTSDLAAYEPKQYFQVMISYEDCDANVDIPEDEMVLESDAISELQEAEKIAHNTAKHIHTKFPDSNIIVLDLDEVFDGYHLIVVDDDGKKVARVGVSITDYTSETIH
jgi:hypothetical protein